ncbi:hypothetical protein TIFTF001_043171 [Ficus carica]|uniref:Uncharacterized protein n=1 Tax=Ficus carica TaxID=3494 RepID=A0AA87Z809_FICCA|nr:hypothetical protein TIFTF001_043171 [Ficus carica]
MLSPLVGLGVFHPTPTVILVGHVNFLPVPGHNTSIPRTIGVRCLQDQVGPGRVHPILVGARS